MACKIHYIVATLVWLFASVAEASPEYVLTNGRIITVDGDNRIAEAVAIAAGRITAVGTSRQVSRLAGARTQMIDLNGRTVIPGLIDTHIHAIRDALTYSRTIDWADVRTLADALQTLRNAAQSTPPGNWLLVTGAWDIHQFVEGRTPTPAELDAVSADHPIYVQHQFSSATMNRAAVQALALSRDSVAAIARGLPVEVEVDASGTPTGVVYGHGYGTTLTRLIAPAFRMSFDEQIASTQRFLDVLNSMGLTGIVDQGDLFDNQYRALFDVWSRSGLPVRVRYNLIPYGIAPGTTTAEDIAALEKLTLLVPPRGGDSYLRFAGLGELLDFGLYDGSLNTDAPVRITDDGRRLGLARSLWAARHGYSINIHATRDATAREILSIFEEVNRAVPVARLRWKIEHGEDLTPETLQRIRALGMGYSVHDRMFYGGDRYVETRGQEIARRSPPIVSAMRLGITVTGGTDGPVISPYNPFVALQWIVDGRSISGTATRTAQELPSRMDALRIYTINGAWSTFEEQERGSIEAGKLADLVVLDRDYLSVPVDQIGSIRPLMTMVGGRPTFARGPFERLRRTSSTRVSAAN